MTARWRVLRLVVLAAALGAGLRAQMTFSYRTSANPAPTSVPNNGSILFAPSAVGGSSTVTLIGTNTGGEPVTLTRATVSGTPFQVNAPTAELAPGQAVTLTLTFTPVDRSQATGSLELQFARRTGAFAYNFFLTGNGQAPELLAAYVLAPDGNQVPIGEGGTIPFPQTAVRGSATATVIIVNRGNGPGTVGGVTISGDAFRLAALPLLPATVQPERDVRFNVVFSPAASGPASGQLRIDLGGRPLLVQLSGQGAAAALSYEFVTEAGIVAISPGATVRMPDTTLGGTSTAVVRVRNGGTLEARVGALAVVGAGFRLADVPPLPATLGPGGAMTFGIAFTPRDPGVASATLLIDTFSVTVEGTGKGARLGVASRIGSVVTPVPEGGAVTFPNTSVGSTNTLYIRVQNAGNLPGTVNGISLSAPVFSLGALPGLPAVIAPGETVEFPVSFSPAAVGTVTATLQIDDRAVTLRGVGDAPPALPAVAFTSLGDTAAALAQPSVGLRLAEPYGADLTGRLALSFVADSFGDDPNIQFASGGRTVEFRIPANTTEAIFGESSRTVPFQAGTVAGVITVSASLAAGSANLTPSPAPSKSVRVEAAAPVIRNVSVGTRTVSSFELLVTGLSTTRSMSQLRLNFTGAPGANLQTTELTINVEAPFASWYQSTAGRSFGSQFTASVIINVNGDVTAVQSVNVTAVNAQGASGGMGVNLR